MDPSLCTYGVGCARMGWSTTSIDREAGGSAMNSNKPTVRLGIDLGKNCFHLWGVDEDGNPVLKKTRRRGALLPMLANLPACRMGLEACAGAHRQTPWQDRSDRHFTNLLVPMAFEADRLIRMKCADCHGGHGLCCPNTSRIDDSNLFFAKHVRRDLAKRDESIDGVTKDPQRSEAIFYDLQGDKILKIKPSPPFPTGRGEFYTGARFQPWHPLGFASSPQPT